MVKLDKALLQQLQAQPDAVVSLIVRVTGDPRDYVARFEDRGLKVNRVFSLIRGLAVQGTGAAALTLQDEPGVVSLEEDRRVTTMSV